jgi:putative redox protein
MDVVALVRKKGKNLNSFDIKVEGTLSKQAPLQYVAVHLVY